MKKLIKTLVFVQTLLMFSTANILNAEIQAVHIQELKESIAGALEKIDESVNTRKTQIKMNYVLAKILWKENQDKKAVPLERTEYKYPLVKRMAYCYKKGQGKSTTYHKVYGQAILFSGKYPSLILTKIISGSNRIIEEHYELIIEDKYNKYPYFYKEITDGKNPKIISFKKIDKGIVLGKYKNSSKYITIEMRKSEITAKNNIPRNKNSNLKKMT